tara:strand:+ start:982 stop:1554 length:573 start_codon:yes stop_codon:yes gene_type:complete
MNYGEIRMRLGDEKTSFRGSGAPRQRFFWPSRAHGLAAVLLLVGLFLALLPRGESFSAEPVTFEKDRLEIVSQAGARLAFDVEVAESAEQKAQGLMFRETLADDAGMIFFYPRPRIITMWMKNTLISLDMLFIAEDGKIMKIVKRTVPLSEKTIASGRRVLSVLELKGGTADRLGLSVGDQVDYPAFKAR